MNLMERVSAAPTLGCALAFKGFIRYRQARENAAGMPVVLLHGIGSGSGSWIEQLADDSLGRVLAWDAPGYADSTALPMPKPLASDYAAVLWAWLDALGIGRVHLVGHSLGCIMAAAAARMQAGRIGSLCLLAPAQGYGKATEEVRERKSQERLQAMASLGLQKMAQQRAPRLVSAHASADQIALATAMMSQLNEGGYAQATQLLAHANIREDLQAFARESPAPLRIACGDQDAITPPQACRALAESLAARYVDIPGAGHLCPLEAPGAVARVIRGLTLGEASAT
jgi:pimeloyl-ACP methyl ester carboxylesterase